MTFSCNSVWTRYAVMGVMSGYMLSVPKYLASYSRSAGISCLICSLVVFLAHFFFLICCLIWRIWRKRIITAQNAKKCLTMSHHLHKSGNQKSGNHCMSLVLISIFFGRGIGGVQSFMNLSNLSWALIVHFKFCIVIWH